MVEMPSLFVVQRRSPLSRTSARPERSRGVPSASIPLTPDPSPRGARGMIPRAVAIASSLAGWLKSTSSRSFGVGCHPPYNWLTGARAWYKG